MNLWVIFLIAISLSMDAFSLAISFGTLGVPLKGCLTLSLVVGIFHFMMPLIGALFGYSFINNVHINTHLLAGTIFLYIGIQMIRDFKNNEKIELNKGLLGMIIFAFGVSLDSLGVGMTLDMKSSIFWFSPLMFALCSFIFTFVGLTLGKVLNKIVGNFAILFGAIIMMLLAMINFVNFCSF